MDLDPINNMKYLLEYTDNINKSEMLEFYRFNEIMKDLSGVARILTYETSGKKNGVWTPLEDNDNNRLLKMSEGQIQNG